MSIEYDFDENITDSTIQQQVESGRIKEEGDDITETVVLDSVEDGDDKKQEEGHVDANLDELNAIDRFLDGGLDDDNDQDTDNDDNNNQEDGDKNEDDNNKEEDDNDDTNSSNTEDDDRDDEDDEDDEDGDGTLLDVLREENLLYIPDDFEGELDEETLEYFKEQTKIFQAQDIITNLRSQYTGDPYSLQVFDHFISGGAFADMPKFMTMVDEVRSYSDYDITNEDNQRSILESYYKEGVDTNSPLYNEMVADIPKRIDRIIEEDLLGEKKAKEAKNYFIQKAETKKQQHEANVADQNRVAAEQEANRIEQERTWHNNFIQSLEDRKWNTEKKESVYNEQYSTVQMENGKNVPIWYAKEIMIKRNPELYQVYLDWLSTSFDINSGAFKSATDVGTEATRKILKMAKKKSTTKARKSQASGKQRKKTKSQQRVLIDPKDNI